MLVCRSTVKLKTNLKGGSKCLQHLLQLISDMGTRLIRKELRLLTGRNRLSLLDSKALTNYRFKKGN